MSLITKEKYDSLVSRLNELGKMLTKNTDDIKNAREQGDLSENAEYDAAKKKQIEISQEIIRIRKTLSEAEIADDKIINKNVIGIFATVKLKNLQTQDYVEYKLVSDDEASLLEKKISIKTKIGEALNGKKNGDIISVETISGLLKFEILDFKY